MKKKKKQGEGFESWKEERFEIQEWRMKKHGHLTQIQISALQLRVVCSWISYLILLSFSFIGYKNEKK